MRPQSEFNACNKPGAKSFDLMTQCKRCIAAYLNKRKAERPARVRATVLIGGVRGRSAPGECDLDLDWILPRLYAGRCERTGIPFEMGFDNPKSVWRPSIDKINPSGGYKKANCQLVVWCYNAAKHTGTDADVLTMARALVKMADVRGDG